MSETAPSTPLPHGMRPEVAKRRIEVFRKRFGEFGDAHLYLAYHAAFPLALTPDLLYRLRANFQKDVHGENLSIPWIAVADLLLSSLCDEVGYELYEMNVAVHTELLNQLKADLKFGPLRMRDLSNFLLTYVRQQLDSYDRDVRDFAQAQYWTALEATRPDEAAHSIALTLSKLDPGDRAEFARIASLIETFTESSTELTQLLTYARGMEQYARGDEEGARFELSKVIGQGESAQVLGINLPMPEELSKDIWEEQAETSQKDFIFTQQEKQNIQLAQERREALQRFRYALQSREPQLIEKVYGTILDGHEDVTKDERRVLDLARQWVNAYQSDSDDVLVTIYTEIMNSPHLRFSFAREEVQRIEAAMRRVTRSQTNIEFRRSELDETMLFSSARLRTQDSELKEGKVETLVVQTMKGPIQRPWGIEGGFAVVYKFRTRSGGLRALRCFRVLMNPDIEFRYLCIGNYFAAYAPDITVSFKYHNAGILVKEIVLGKIQTETHPIIEMDWVEGMTLIDYVDELCKKRDRSMLKNLSEQWLSILKTLHEANIAHGDLAGSNVMVGIDGRLVLIDYDGVYIPIFAGMLPAVIGQPDYQHPDMQGRQFNERMDDFSALVIYIALLALHIKPELWDKYTQKDSRGRLLGTNLLFLQQDFLAPDQSILMNELEELGDAEVKRLVQELKRACHQPVNQVPHFIKYFSLLRSNQIIL